jgi:hypothetical protein
MADELRPWLPAIVGALPLAIWAIADPVGFSLWEAPALVVWGILAAWSIARLPRK